MNAWMKLDKLDQLDVGNLSKKKCLSKDFQILKNRSIYLDGFLRFAFIFCGKQAFSRLQSFFSRLWLSHWLWNLNILKIHSIYDLTVYKMSIFGKDWSVQIFFTKNVHCPMGRSSFFEPCRIFTQVNWKSELFLGIGSTKFN